MSEARSLRSHNRAPRSRRIVWARDSRPAAASPLRARVCEGARLPVRGVRKPGRREALQMRRKNGSPSDPAFPEFQAKVKAHRAEDLEDAWLRFLGPLP